MFSCSNVQKHSLGAIQCHLLIRWIFTSSFTYLLLLLLLPYFLYSQDSTNTVKQDSTKTVTEDPKKDKKKLSDVLQVRGYLKDMQTVFIPAKGNSLSHNFYHLRINAKAYITKSITFAVESRTRMFYGELVRATPGFAESIGADAGYVDMTELFVDADAFAFATTIDRLWLNWSGKKFDVRLGRQRINWGLNLVWNPNDLFNAYNFLDFDYEEKPGTDAARAQYYLNDISSVELAAKFSMNPDSTVVAGMYKFNKWEYDFQVLGGVYYSDLTIGVGWAGNLKTAGLKGEANYFHPRSYFADTSGILNASVSIDYTFKKPIYVNGSILYNSVVITNLKAAGPVQSQAFFTNISAKNLMPTRFSFFGQVNGTLSPLLKVDLAAMYGAGINLLVAIPSITYSLKQNWDLVLIGQLFFMDNVDKFGNAGNYVFLRLKWSY